MGGRQGENGWGQTSDPGGIQLRCEPGFPRGLSYSLEPRSSSLSLNLSPETPAFGRRAGRPGVNAVLAPVTASLKFVTGKISEQQASVSSLHQV